MKKAVLMLMVAGLFAAMPVLAEKHEMMSAGEHMDRCVMQSDAIDKKIDRLQDEIKKGNKKYSAAELKKLEDKLKEANDMLDVITKP